MLKVAAAGLGGIAVLGVAVYGSLALTEGARAPERTFFKNAAGQTLVIAHRGGARQWPENTLHAFERAVEAGVDTIEMDVRTTADGALVVMHDPSVERTTDGSGRVEALTLAELQSLDAAHRFTPDGGQSFPLRGRGVRVPTLAEVFEKLPHARYIIEIKDESPQTVESLCALINQRAMGERVVVGSFRQPMLDEFRRACSDVATSASTLEASKFLALYEAGLAESYSPPMQALMVPERLGGMTVLTRGFVAAAHARNLHVHAWTINDPADMRRLLDAGVDGIMTDYPERLLALLGRK